MDHDDRFDLRGYLRLLWRRAWLVALCGALFALGGFWIARQQPDRYQAVARVQVLDPNDERVFGGPDSRSDTTRDVQPEIGVITSDAVRTRAADALGDEAGQVVGVSASATPPTDVVTLRVVASSAAGAQDGANAIVDAYLAERQQSIRSTFEARADELRARSADLGAQVQDLEQQISDDPGQAEELRRQVEDLQSQISDLDKRAGQQDVEASARTPSAVVVQAAELPAGPYDPRPVYAALISGFVGLVLGAAVVLVLHRLDDRLTAATAAAVDIPVLGAIPRRGSARAFRRGRSVEPRTLLDGDALEPFRILRTHLRHVAGSGGRSLLVTGPSGGEGASTVTANLAIALAEADLRVVVVSADLRRPTLASYFGVDGGPGLTDVLQGSASVASVAHRVPTSRGILYVVASGAPPDDPSGALEADALTEMLQWLADAGGDYVLLDTPPTLPVADASMLSEAVDGVIVVGAFERTRQSELRAAIEQLRGVDADVVGVVVNGVPPRSAYRSDQWAPSARSTAGSVLTTMRASSPSDQFSM